MSKEDKTASGIPSWLGKATGTISGGAIVGKALHKAYEAHLQPEPSPVREWLREQNLSPEEAQNILIENGERLTVEDRREGFVSDIPQEHLTLADPLAFALPVIGALTGAIAGHELGKKNPEKSILTAGAVAAGWYVANEIKYKIDEQSSQQNDVAQQNQKQQLDVMDNMAQQPSNDFNGDGFIG